MMWFYLVSLRPGQPSGHGDEWYGKEVMSIVEGI